MKDSESEQQSEKEVSETDNKSEKSEKRELNGHDAYLDELD